MGQEEEDLVSQWEEDNSVHYIEELDRDIDMKELETAILRLKSDKAAGHDNILNEFIKYGNNTLKSVILKIYNTVFKLGCFPHTWAIGEIVPVFKKGDRENPENYRGITLLSCLGKIFTSILNNRLNEWGESNGVFCENQFGFRKHRGTTDCLFVLHGVIELFLNHSKPLYCAFIDLKRAFDSANRRALWFKLNKNKISSKIINLLRNMYSKIKLSVKQSANNLLTSNTNNNNPSDCYFTSHAGVFQGESLSPFLFSMFLNDLDTELKTINDIGINLNGWLLTILLFADDMVLLSESRNGLQKGLDNLSEYCDRWGLTVNVNKTKCVVFKKGGKLGRLDKWKYRGEDIETVTHFKYLGFTLGSSGKFAKGIESLCGQGQRALFSLKSIFHRYPEMMPETQMKLYHALVSPILSYSCEIWGFCEADPLEKLHIGFLKSILGVRKTIPSAFIYKECNESPLINERLKRILNYWLKIINLDDTNPVKIVYNLLIQDAHENPNLTNWASLLRNMLTTRGFGDVWLQQQVPDVNTFSAIFVQRISDMSMQQNCENISNVSEYRLYKHFTNNIICTDYLHQIKEKFIRVAISRMRLGSHNFMIERGRWHRPKLEYPDRVCEECGVVEDEYHIIIECKRFDSFRTKFLPKFLIVRPNMYKFISFINTTTGKNLKNFGLFCHRVLFNYNNNVL